MRSTKKAKVGVSPEQFLLLDIDINSQSSHSDVIHNEELRGKDAVFVDYI